MTMTFFQYVKAVLDEGYYDLQKSHKKTTDRKIQTALKKLSDSFANDLTDPDADSVNYSSDLTRLAYVYCYTTCHARIVDCVLRKQLKNLKIFDKEKLVVSCVGGGPGSDYLGIVRYLEDTGYTGKLQCYLLDREEAWGDMWSDLGSRWEGLDFQPSTYFQRFDVTDNQSWTIQKKYQKADLFTFCYFVSEVYKLDPNEYFLHLFDHAKDGSVFLYIDNDSTEFTDWFDNLIQRAGITEIVSDTVVCPNPCNKTLPIEEEKNDLEPYLTKFGRSPRLKARVKCKTYIKK